MVRHVGVPIVQTAVVANLKDIGRRVAALRTERQLGQIDLAAEVGVSRSTIAGIESGNDRGGILTMIAIADYFKVPLDWLLARDVPPGGPLIGQFVDDADKLAWLAFWDGLNDADRSSALRLLQVPSLEKRRA